MLPGDSLGCDIRVSHAEWHQNNNSTRLLFDAITPVEYWLLRTWSFKSVGFQSVISLQHTQRSNINETYCHFLTKHKEH